MFSFQCSEHFICTLCFWSPYNPVRWWFPNCSVSPHPRECSNSQVTSFPSCHYFGQAEISWDFACSHKISHSPWIVLATISSRGTAPLVTGHCKRNPATLRADGQGTFGSHCYKESIITPVITFLYHFVKCLHYINMLISGTLSHMGM